MAARGINKVILIGLLGQEPDIRYIPNGGAVATLSLATGETWRDKQTGELRENTEWHRVVIYGKLAELAGEYLHKGAQVYIEGQLKTRKWQDNHGIDRYVTEVVVNAGGVRVAIRRRIIRTAGRRRWQRTGKGKNQKKPHHHRRITRRGILTITSRSRVDATQ